PLTAPSNNSAKDLESNGDSESPLLPLPLRSYVGASPDELDWQQVIRGLEEFDLDVGGAKTKLLRIKPGASMPQHTHEGCELTLVLDGSYDDEIGHFARGDVVALDTDNDHRPVASPGRDCICLTLIDAPLRLTGRFGRFLNPFVKF
ncbi:MAG: ChrR family anti-sigma-E factor, partial [Thiohalocapsa sp.]